MLHLVCIFICSDRPKKPPQLPIPSTAFSARPGACSSVPEGPVIGSNVPKNTNAELLEEIRKMFELFQTKATTTATT